MAEDQEFGNSINIETELSEIQTFYYGTTVFLTGATGFMGHLIIEKLLRTCSNVKKIYLLIREKRNTSTNERLQRIFNNEMFKLLKKEQPEFLEKISLIPGDCLMPNLGIEEKYQQILKNEVNIVIHSAASVNLNENLRKATSININALQDLLKLSKDMKCLKSFVYISTAYSNCTLEKKILDEVFYKPYISADELNKIVYNYGDNDISDENMSKLLNSWPNTYTMTKAIAENEILNIGNVLPIGIVRPSMIISTYQEPIPGWINNMYGPTGVYSASIAGILRFCRGTNSNISDIIPGDYASNAVIACAWDIHNRWRENIKNYNMVDNEADSSVKHTYSPPIYNLVSSSRNPVTIAQFSLMVKEQEQNINIAKSKWPLKLNFIQSEIAFIVLWFLFHTVPGFFIDLLAMLTRQKSPKLLIKYENLLNFIKASQYFCLHTWIIRDNNTLSLVNKMSKLDKSLFMFDVANIKWYEYCKKYVLGIHKYILKTPLETKKCL